ncbi:tetratricopeptide repeat protein [Duganella sp. sic0402]|nr:tetratricopeptide repeat protein [Duganella sp. sic0402]
MLQDLDARGGAGDAPVPDDIKAVPVAERDRRPLLIAGAAAGVLVLAAGGWYGWQYWQSHSAPPPGPPPKIVDNRPHPDSLAQGESANPAALPAAKPGMPAPTPAVVDAPGAGAAAQEALDTPEPASAPALQGAQPDASPTRAAAAPKSRRAADPADAADAARRRKPAATPADGIVQHDLTPKQMSENSYRRALAALQEGRVNVALADLDKAVELDPRNDAARQTYVSLLLENRRTDDAIRQLRLALGVEPRQPGLAMVLARLQLEKGGPALETLLKTLPYAANNADYLAFLAGVLQREQRHTEAAEQYRNALAMVPDNAIWWMGLGISLQADQHLPEAREAYRHARAGTGLTPELKAFIDRKLDQLSR